MLFKIEALVSVDAEKVLLSKEGPEQSIEQFIEAAAREYVEDCECFDIGVEELAVSIN